MTEQSGTTWESSKTHLMVAQKKAKERQKATLKMGGFRGADDMCRGQLDQAAHALINMATTAVEDKEKMRVKGETITSSGSAHHKPDQATLCSPHPDHTTPDHQKGKCHPSRA